MLCHGLAIGAFHCAYSCSVASCAGALQILLGMYYLPCSPAQSLLNASTDDTLLSCRTMTACVLWEITMQDLQPIVDWQEHVADMLVSISTSLLLLSMHKPLSWHSLPPLQTSCPPIPLPPLILPLLLVNVCREVPAVLSAMSARHTPQLVQQQAQSGMLC